MFRYLRLFINYKIVLIFVLGVPAVNILILGDLYYHAPSNHIVMFVWLLTATFFIPNKKVINDILWILPLKRSQLWVVFILRMIILSFGLIVSNIITNLICKHPFFEVQTLVIYSFLLPVVISIYNARTILINFNKKTTDQFNYYPILFALLLPFLSMVGCYIIFKIYKDTAILPAYLTTILSISIIYAIAASYFITMKTKTLINFRVG